MVLLVLVVLVLVLLVLVVVVVSVYGCSVWLWEAVVVRERPAASQPQLYWCDST